jgi:UPF0755 protein
MISSLIKSLKTRLLLLFAGGLFVVIGILIYGVLQARLPFVLGIKLPEHEVQMVIPEGFTVEQIGELFESEGIFNADDFISVAEEHEGYLFPDTYRFFRNVAPEEVVKQMRGVFDKKVVSVISEELIRQEVSLRDIVIMASLIEKEVHNLTDQRIVSGILWKRLEIGMGLQVDATLLYLNNNKNSDITAEDLEIDSLYNTYKYRGLPPGPITNPGLGAIEAALYPTPSEYLYYLSDKEGNTHYAENFEDHKLNKQRYLR